jgi:hypothetical protein
VAGNHPGTVLFLKKPSWSRSPRMPIYSSSHFFFLRCCELVVDAQTTHAALVAAVRLRCAKSNNNSSDAPADLGGSFSVLRWNDAARANEIGHGITS